MRVVMVVRRKRSRCKDERISRSLERLSVVSTSLPDLYGRCLVVMGKFKGY